MSYKRLTASTQMHLALRPTRLNQALAVALLISLTPLAATAATIMVTSPDDTNAIVTTTCTLRQAILSMNTGLLKGNCTNTGASFGTNDTIRFASSAVIGAATAGTVTLADSADNTGAIGGTLLITAAKLTVDASLWRGEGANQYPGGITITRPTGATTDFGIINDIAEAGGSLTLNGLSVSNGKVTRGGGVCIRDADLTLIKSTISGNFADGEGGGIYSHGGTLVLTNSAVSGNSANTSGGGIRSHHGALVLINSTISGNSTASRGGGIYVLTATLALTNSTVSGNSAGSNGGGIFAYVSKPSLTHTTVSNNSAQSKGGAIYGYASATISNSIVAGNTQASGTDIKLGGGWTGTNNLLSVSGLNLGSLQNNGGPTQTLLPGLGSTAIDSVPAGSCSLLTDQRGLARPQGPLCDIGAVEVSAVFFEDGFEGS